MRDPVALAYSGRLDEARREAAAQVSSDDPFLARQGLEALAVLGQQHGMRSDPDLDALLSKHARANDRTADRAFEAAAALDSNALESEAILRLTRGEATWFVLRYVGEQPSHRLALALAETWEQVLENHRDQALLTTCVLPAANRAEAQQWGRRAEASLADEREEVRLSALAAMDVWRTEDTPLRAARALADDSPEVRRRAAELLERIAPELLAERASEITDEFPDLARFASRRSGGKN